MHEDEKMVILIIYVDDLFVIGNHTKRIEWFVGQLINRFKMFQLGGMEFYFQVEFLYFPSGIFIDALLSPGVNPLEGFSLSSCGKLRLGARSRLPTLERGRGSCWEPRD
jgi:hypothetical protein